MLTLDEGILLVRKTRRGVEAYLDGKGFDPGPKDASELWKNRGVFVTIKEVENNMLRGCIGNPFPERPLVVEAIESGILAATSDPRFEPVTSEEMRLGVCLELTALSVLREIGERERGRVESEIRIGRDGLMVEGFGRRGLLLPQVAVEEDFRVEEFLTNCCLKAGLPPDAWLSAKLKIHRFEGQIFSERTPSAEASEVELSRR